MSVLRFIPTPIYISLYYWAATGKWPDLKHPTYFNEKLQWMKIHEDYTKYRDYADKIKVRDIIEEKIGDGYMFPMLGKWKSFDEIDFDSLPEEFVLKCNHDSGSVKVTPFGEYPGKGRATGGVRCHRFLRDEDILLLGWAGPRPAIAAAASGSPIDLPSATGKRDGSGTPSRQPIAAVASRLLR